MIELSGNSESLVERGERGVSNSTLFVALLVLLAWAPIPIGSNRIWSLSALEAVSFFIVGAWALLYALRPFPIPDTVRDVRLSLCLFVIFSCLPLVQLLPLPPQVVRLVSHEIYEHYSSVPDGLSSVVMSLTLDRGATFSGFLRHTALVCVFFSVVALATTRERIRALLILMFSVGLFEAIYGLVLYFGGENVGLWNPGDDPRTVSGTYVNQNHFSGLLEITIAAGMGLFIMSTESGRSDANRLTVTRRVLALLAGQRGIVIFGLLVMFSALMLATSRGAIGSLFLALAATIALALGKRRSAASVELKIGLTAIALVVVAIVWLGTGRLSDKLASSGLSSHRAELRELSYRIASDYPLTGSGLGTYRWVLPGYKDERFGSGFYEHAHNDYLEILGEQGVLGLSLVVIAVGVVAIRVLREYARQQDPQTRGALFSCAVGCIALSLHGFVDFNFQIPANAMYFFALLGLGAAAATVGSDSSA